MTLNIDNQLQQPNELEKTKKRKNDKKQRENIYIFFGIQ